MEIKEKYGNGRRTRVRRGRAGDFKEEDLIPNEEAIITLTQNGYIKRMLPSAYHVQKRGGKGVIGAVTKESDAIKQVNAVLTHDNLMFFTDTGKVYQIKAHEIPQFHRTAKGQAIVNFLQLASEEKITEMIAFNKDDNYKYLFMATEEGIVKKSNLKDFENVRHSGLIAIKLGKDDKLRWVKPTTGSDTISITTAEGQAIKFKESDVRSMGRNATGVKGIKLKENDKVVGMDTVLNRQKGNQLMVITENGYGKRSNLNLYKIQKRGGSALKPPK